MGGEENQTKKETILKFNRILVDTSFFYGIFDKRDQHHADAKKINIEKLGDPPDTCSFVLPWPILYETVNTRFVKHGHLSKLEEFLRHQRTELFDDMPYRQRVYKSARDYPREPKFRIPADASLVDSILRLMIEDSSAKIDGIITFDHALRKFGYDNGIEVLPSHSFRRRNN